MVKIKNDQIGLKAALAGELDSFEGGPGGAIVADSRGVDVRVIGCTVACRAARRYFVHDNIKSMEELKGKTIAISAPGSFPDILARGALANFNVPADNVKFATVGGDLDRYKALVAHVVDAAVVSGEYLPVAEKEHIKMLVSGSGGAAEFRSHVHPGDGKAPAGAARRCGEIPGGADRGTALCGRAQGRGDQGCPGGDRHQADDPRPAFIYDLAMKQNAIGVDMPIPMDKFAWLQNELVHLGKIKTTMDVNKLIDAKPREAGLSCSSR